MSVTIARRQEILPAEEIGPRIDTARQAAGMSEGSFCRKAGWNFNRYTFLCDKETGGVRHDELSYLAEVLGVHEGFLLGTHHLDGSEKKHDEAVVEVQNLPQQAPCTPPATKVDNPPKKRVPEDKRIFSANCKALVDASMKTRVDISGEMGASPNFISQMLSGGASISGPNPIIVAEYFGVTTSWLLDGVRKPDEVAKAIAAWKRNGRNVADIANAISEIKTQWAQTQRENRSIFIDNSNALFDASWETRMAICSGMGKGTGYLQQIRFGNVSISGDAPKLTAKYFRVTTSWLLKRRRKPDEVAKVIVALKAAREKEEKTDD